MISQIFKTGGGAGIGSYVLVIRNGILLNPKAEKIRWSYDSGENLYLSIIDDSTEEALLPLTGYVDLEDILHLSGRDFDDNKTYQITIHGKTHEITVEIIDGITLGDGIIDNAFKIPEYEVSAHDISQEFIQQVYEDHPTMFKLHITYEGGSYEPGSYDWPSEDFFFIFGRENKGYTKLDGEKREFSVLTYFSINPFCEIEGGSTGSRDPYIEEDDMEGITFYFGKIEGYDKYMFTADDFDMGGLSRKDVDEMIYDWWYYTIKPYIDEHGGNPRLQQMTATIVQDPITNINGRVLTKFAWTVSTIQGYTVILVGRGRTGEYVYPIDKDEASKYMEFMTGSQYVPLFNYEKPQNSLFVMPNGSFWKPQWDKENGMVLWSIPNPYLTTYTCHPISFDLNKEGIVFPQADLYYVVEYAPAALTIQNMKFYGYNFNMDKGNQNKVYYGFMFGENSSQVLILDFSKKDSTRYKCDYTVYNLGGGGPVDITTATTEDIDNMFLEMFSITRNVGDGVTFGNYVDEIREDSEYYTDLFFDGYYLIDQITVTMDGEDITQDSYFGSFIRVDEVIGDIVITILTSPNPNMVRVGSAIENGYAYPELPTYTIRYGGLSANIYPNYPYNNLDVYVTVNGVDVTSTAWDPANNYLYIDNVDGDVYISAIATGGVFPVTLNINGCYATNYSSEAIQGSHYDNLITSSTGSFSSASFYMNYESIYGTYAYWSDKEGGYVIDIPAVTGPIEINCEPEAVVYNVFIGTTNVGYSNDEGSATEGQAYQNIFFPAEGYVFSPVECSITMDGSAYDYFDSLVWSEKELGYVLYIDEVTGDIHINLVARPEGQNVYEVHYNLSNCIAMSRPQYAISGQTLQIMLMSNGDGYDSVSASVGQHVDPNWVSISARMANITIPGSEIDDTVVINAAGGSASVYSVTYDLGENIISNNMQATVPAGAPYTARLTAPFHFTINVKNGQFITDSTSDYDSQTGNEYFNVTAVAIGDITITARRK